MKMLWLVLLATVMALTAAMLGGGTQPNGVLAQPPSCETVFLAGVVDEFDTANGPELTSPSSNLVTALGGTYKNFDDPTINRQVAHTFLGLPDGIVDATLETRLRAGGEIVYNDSIMLTFIGDDLIAPPPGDERWSRRIGDDLNFPVTIPGLIDDLDPSLDYLGSYWDTGEVGTFVLDLGALPLGTLPASAGNLIPALNTNGFLDFYIQDDTEVDYIRLTVWTCPRPVGGTTDLLTDGSDAPRSAAEGSGTTAPLYAAIASAAVVAFAASGWYVRRRFLR